MKHITSTLPPCYWINGTQIIKLYWEYTVTNGLQIGHHYNLYIITISTYKLYTIKPLGKEIK